MTQPQPEPLLDVARGDAARSQQLRTSLKVLRDRTESPEFRKLLDDVLAGRSGLREAARSPLFDQAVTPRVQQAVERLNEMSDEEKQRLAAEGERQLEQIREDLAAPPPQPSRPPADQDDDPGGDGFLRPSW